MSNVDMRDYNDIQFVYVDTEDMWSLTRDLRLPA